MLVKTINNTRAWGNRVQFIVSGKQELQDELPAALQN